MKHLLLVSFMILMMGFSKAQPVVHYVTTTGAGDKSGVSGQMPQMICSK